MIWPNGHVLADTTFKNADDAWRIGLGWPDKKAIELAKAQGYQVKWVKISHD
jgi:hypothetical protein